MVISQVYGGGAGGTSTYKNDFIELLNRSATPVDLSTWSVQYAAATGTTWYVTNLSGTLQPGHYYLVAESAGTTGLDLPTPEATGTTSMAAGAGKVALVNSTTKFTISCPTADATLVDFVGYGTTSNCSLGSPTANTSATTAALRAGSGCTDTRSNSADFNVAAPAPRNSASPTNACACP